MTILGINGSPDGGHDASACIVKEGKLCVVAEEERFIRQKHAYDMYPHAATQYCLQYMGISLDQVDQVAFSWDLPLLYREKWEIRQNIFFRELFPKNLFSYKNLPECRFIPHHLAHAASTFWLSGFSESSILIMDGQGEKASGVMAYGNQKEGIKVLNEFPVEFSLGYLYKAASGFTGLGQENPGKLMGLSSYGRPTLNFSSLEISEKGYKFTNIPQPKNLNPESFDNMDEIVEYWWKYFSDKCEYSPMETRKMWNFLKNEWNYELPRDVQHYADFAASIQNIVEKVGCHLVSQLIKKTGCSFVSLAGGVALNCGLNGKIAQMPDVENLFIVPTAHDSGTSIGAALQLSFQLGVKPIQKRLTTCYLGPNFTDTEIKEILEELQIPYKEFSDDELVKKVANLLCTNTIVAIFRGKSEIGPRALGHRSIIASPCSTQIRDHVNNIKGRELWRPLCPSVLEEYAHDFFHDADKGSPFMLRFLFVREEKVDQIPGVVHVDNTARVQLVDSKSDYGRFIEAFRQISSIPMVLNTSFNLAGEPIVGSPIDALRTFFTSSIDALVLGNCLIVK